MNLQCYNRLWIIRDYRQGYAISLYELLENGITEEMFAKTHGIIVLDFSGTQDSATVWTSTLRLEWIFAGLSY